MTMISSPAQYSKPLLYKQINKEIRGIKGIKGVKGKEVKRKENNTQKFTPSISSKYRV